jgi:phenylacetate-CoA ligase
LSALTELTELAALFAVGWRGREALDSMRRRRLARLVRHAYEHVPYYRARMGAAGLRPADVSTPADLRRMPVTTKADLRAAGDAALSRGAGSLIARGTSGYSGQPFVTYRTPSEARVCSLRDFRALVRAGFRPLDRLAVLGPDRFRPRRAHHRLGPYRQEIIRGSLSVDEQSRRLRDFAPTVLWAYPTMLRSVLAAQGHRLSRLAQPRILITSSEVLDPVFRGQILRDRPVEIFNFYGAVEVGRIGAECRSHAGLHVEADALIVELLDGDRMVEPGAPGRVVLTSLENYAMPMIRYDLGDLSAEICGSCPCGWPTPRIEAPMGRNTDMVTLPDGGRVSATRLNFVLREQRDLLQFRFRQDSADRIEAQLVYERPPAPQDLAGLRAQLEAALAGQIRVDVRVVDRIAVEGGKFKYLVSSLPGAQVPGAASPPGVSG